MSFNYDESDCPFCSIPDERLLAENPATFAILDGFPVTALHTLIIPKRHFADYFQSTEEELIACTQLLREMRGRWLAEDNSIVGFNIGVNIGEVAGQTIGHCHIHLIPRRAGDVENPRGGIRHVIPGKGNY